MTSTTYESPYLTLESATAAPARGRYRVWLTIPLFCLFFMLLGHDFGRSLLMDEEFNVDDAEMQQRVEQGVSKYRLAFVGIGLMGGMLLITAGGDSFRMRNLLAFCILAVIGWSFASVIWADDAALTLRRLFTLLCSFLGMMGMARAYRAIDICWWAFIFTLSMAALGLCAEIALGTFRPWQFEYRFAGLVHPNTQGVELTILILSSVVLLRNYPRWRPLFVSVIAAAVLGLIMTKSRTSAACCLLALIVLWTINTSVRVKLGTLLVMMMLGGLFFGTLLTIGVDDPDGFSQVLQMGREDEVGSFTGRIPIWTTLLEEVSLRPWTGYGFNSYFDEEALAYIAKEHEWAVPNAHNAYIETALNTGYIGVVLVLMTVLVGIYMTGTARVRAVDGSYSLFFALAVFALLNAVFESMMVINFNFPPSLLAAGFCRLAFFEDVPWERMQPLERPPVPKDILK